MLTFRDPSAEHGLGPDDLLVPFEGDVATDHVKEQNAQRPDGERDSSVGLGQDPLWRTVDPSTWHRGDQRYRGTTLAAVKLGREVWVSTFKFTVRCLFERSSRPKVYDLDLERPHVDHDVLIFNVSVQNAMSVHEL